MPVAGDAYASLEALLVAVRACRACAGHLPLGPRPVLSAAAGARILVVGQAPGARVHETGIAWDDASGVKLREWMGITPETFHDAAQVAIIPMGFCYPGRGKGGDLPPRPECSELWMAPLLAKLPRIELVLLVGQYAQRRFLGARRKASLTETTRAWREYAPRYLPLPHPSPRNTPWFQRHPWFEAEVLPEVRSRVASLLTGNASPAS